MNDVLRLILSLSLSGSILALILFGIKPFIKDRLSKSIQYYIWIIVLLRLILPFSFEESIMNKIFYTNSIKTEIFPEKEIQYIELEDLQESSIFNISNAEENVEYRSYNFDIDHSRYSKDVFHKSRHYIFYFYLLGVLITLSINVISYLRFLKILESKNREATEVEYLLLNSLMDKKNKVDLLRNSLVSTPMLIGVFNPRIVIPDRQYSKNQLKNIFLHELIHLKRFDIEIRWITMIVKSIHWFNPMVYIIGKEINHACELSCDEAVIKNLDNNEKQAYGHTLISMLSEEKDFCGTLQVTMSEDKNVLKDRLVAIMNYSRKSKATILISGILVLGIIVGSLYLGGGTVKDNSNKDKFITREELPPLITINSENHPDIIGNYATLKTQWNGKVYESSSFYQRALSGIPNVLASIRKLDLGEEITVDFGENKPDRVLVKMAYLTKDFGEQLLPIEDISVIHHGDGVYKFKNPEKSADHIGTTGRTFSVEAAWGDNICEYVFVTDEKIPNYFVKVEWIPVEPDIEKLEELQKDIYYEPKSFIAVSSEFIDSLGFSSENANRIQIENNSDNKIIRYEFEELAKAIESRVVQPIKNGIDGVWAIDSYRIVEISD